MSNRGCLLLLLLPPFASDAKFVSGQNLAVQVHVCNYTNLKPAALAELTARTQDILTRSGVSAEVEACPRGLSTPCRNQSCPLRQLEIRVIPKVVSNGADSGRQLLGQAFAGHNGGTYGTIFLKQAQEAASEANLPTVIVLAYAATHEIGHLLLGDHAHVARGLMRAQWAAEGFLAMAQNQLHFAPKQIQELKERYGTSRRDEPGEDSALPRGGGDEWLCAPQAEFP
jgi:hypothetical protein